MSWSCDECGGDRTEDHGLCRIASRLENIQVTLELISKLLLSPEAIKLLDDGE